MKPIQNLPLALLLTLVLAFGGAWFASIAGQGGRASAAVNSDPSQGWLSVEITEIRNEGGTIIALVFDDAEAYRAYDDQRAVGYQEVASDNPTARLDFHDLVEGPYAVVLWHDANGDQDFNMSGGYPEEGWGTSGALDMYDEPSFRRAAVAVGHTRVQMYYPDW